LLEPDEAKEKKIGGAPKGRKAEAICFFTLRNGVHNESQDQNGTIMAISQRSRIAQYDYNKAL